MSQTPFVQDIFLSSEDRNSGTNYNAAWQIDPRQIKSLDSGFDIALLEFSMKNLRYSTHSANNKIYFEEKTSGNVKVATITAGTYDIAGYLVYLKTALEAASENTLTYTCTYDVYTDRITVSTTQSFRFRYVISGLTVNSHAYNQLGVDLASQVDSTSATSLQMAYPYALNGSTCVAVACNLAISNYCSDHQSNVLAMIPVDVNYGETLIYVSNATDPVAAGQRVLDRIELTLLDEYGYAYELPANVVVTYRLRVFCRPDNDTPQTFNFQGY